MKLFLTTLFPLFAITLISACSTSPSLGSLTIPAYRQDVVQGNVVVKEQVLALRVGMSKTQVRNILGTPLLTSAFHADRWDYAFSLLRDGQQVQKRNLTVFFQGDSFLRVEGDEMPSETEFATSLGGGKKINKKIPLLQASEKDLQAFSQRENAGRLPKVATTGAAADDPVADPNKVYPPLEAPSK